MSSSAGGRGELGGLEMGKGVGWKQLHLLGPRWLGWGLRRAGAVRCPPTPPAPQHPPWLPPWLRKQMNFPESSLKSARTLHFEETGGFRTFLSPAGLQQGERSRRRCAAECTRSRAPGVWN